jgi:D-alanyl-D-alanine carboxypeptidase/D-alanyl-D-alanine-endopeptidase (penicillin-binding protein 4)
MRPVRILLALLACLLALDARADAPALQGAAEEIVGTSQGVFAVTEQGEVLAALNIARAVHPASVSKVATTLALLRRLGPEHRFETRLVASAPVEEGRLRGDLVVEAAGDPVLVYENAFLMMHELHGLGIRAVDGELVVRGPLLFNWQPDGTAALRRALEGRAGAEAWPAVQARVDGVALPELALTFAGHAASAPRSTPRVLVVNRSPPLVRIVKALNCYSNNVFHLLADRIGGPATVQRIGREAVPEVEAGEIVIDNAAGAGTTNRLSPRAAVALVTALERELGTHALALPDVLPVASVDPGTLHTRLSDAVVGKTGTYGSLGASALAGVVRTKRWGAVTFAVLNRGVPVPEAQRRQNAFVDALLRAGEPVSWPHHTLDAPAFTGASVERGG